MQPTQRLAALAAALAFAFGTRADAGGATAFPVGINADDCSSITIVGNWLTPVNGQDNVYYVIHDAKTLNSIVASDPVSPGQTSAFHAFAIDALPKGKHRLSFSMQVRVGTAPIIGVSKNLSVGCAP